MLTKANRYRLALAFILAASSSLFAGLGSPTSQVRAITQMGGRWGNANAGGLLIYLTNMPSDIAYFIVRPQDLGLKGFQSQCEISLAGDRAVTIGYDRTNFVSTVNGINQYEGELISITLQ